jgi:hypothetical protein
MSTVVPTHGRIINESVKSADKSLYLKHLVKNIVVVSAGQLLIILIISKLIITEIRL